MTSDRPAGPPLAAPSSPKNLNPAAPVFRQQDKGQSPFPSDLVSSDKEFQLSVDTASFGGAGGEPVDSQTPSQADSGGEEGDNAADSGSVGVNDSTDVINDDIVYPDDIVGPIKKQLEYYFSSENLPSDKYINTHMDINKFVPLKLFISFNRMKPICSNVNQMVQAVQTSSLLELNEDKTKVRISQTRKTLTLRSLPPKAVEDDVRRVLEENDCPKPMHVEMIALQKAQVSNWYVSFSSEQECLDAFFKLHNTKVMVDGYSIGCCIKSSGTLAATGSFPTQEENMQRRLAQQTQQPPSSVVSSVAGSLSQQPSPAAAAIAATAATQQPAALMQHFNPMAVHPALIASAGQGLYYNQNAQYLPYMTGMIAPSWPTAAPMEQGLMLQGSGLQPQQIRTQLPRTHLLPNAQQQRFSRPPRPNHRQNSIDKSNMMDRSHDRSSQASALSNSRNSPRPGMETGTINPVTSSIISAIPRRPNIRDDATVTIGAHQASNQQTHQLVSAIISQPHTVTVGPTSSTAIVNPVLDNTAASVPPNPVTVPVHNQMMQQQHQHHQTQVHHSLNPQPLMSNMGGNSAQSSNPPVMSQHHHAPHHQSHPPHHHQHPPPPLHHHQQQQQHHQQQSHQNQQPSLHSHHHQHPHHMNQQNVSNSQPQHIPPQHQPPPPPGSQSLHHQPPPQSHPPHPHHHHHHHHSHHQPSIHAHQQHHHHQAPSGSHHHHHNPSHQHHGIIVSHHQSSQPHPSHHPHHPQMMQSSHPQQHHMQQPPNLAGRQDPANRRNKKRRDEPNIRNPRGERQPPNRSNFNSQVPPMPDNFTMEANSFPPLPGASSTPSSEVSQENRMMHSDIVKGVARAPSLNTGAPPPSATRGTSSSTPSPISTPAITPSSLHSSATIVGVGQAHLPTDFRGNQIDTDYVVEDDATSSSQEEIDVEVVAVEPIASMTRHFRQEVSLSSASESVPMSTAQNRYVKANNTAPAVPVSSTYVNKNVESRQVSGNGPVSVPQPPRSQQAQVHHQQILHVVEQSQPDAAKEKLSYAQILQNKKDAAQASELNSSSSPAVNSVASMSSSSSTANTITNGPNGSVIVNNSSQAHQANYSNSGRSNNHSNINNAFREQGNYIATQGTRPSSQRPPKEMSGAHANRMDNGPQSRLPNGRRNSKENRVQGGGPSNIKHDRRKAEGRMK